MKEVITKINRTQFLEVRLGELLKPWLIGEWTPTNLIMSISGHKTESG